jgi:hypothetical protein
MACIHSGFTNALSGWFARGFKIFRFVKGDVTRAMAPCAMLLYIVTGAVLLSFSMTSERTPPARDVKPVE